MSQRRIGATTRFPVTCSVTTGVPMAGAESLDNMIARRCMVISLGAHDGEFLRRHMTMFEVDARSAEV